MVNHPPTSEGDATGVGSFPLAPPQQAALRGENPPATAGDMRPGFHPWVGTPLEKAMASHSSTLAWRIPWIEEPVGL